MPDVLQKVINSNNYKNGTAVVSVDKLGVVTNHTLDTVFNQTSQIATQSGILDTRFDDVRYYSGDSAS
jgi:hypothetical protein